MKPILFNTEMVRAILDGRKTVTRRVVKPQPDDSDDIIYLNYNCMKWFISPDNNAYAETEVKSPYQPGDILYVRETWCKYSKLKDDLVTPIDGTEEYYYRADGENPTPYNTFLVQKDGYDEYRDSPLWCPSIHMPKEAARLFLRVTDVRVERLQNITVDGVLHEGTQDVEPPPICREEKSYPGIFPKWFDQWSKERQDDWFKARARTEYIGWCGYADKLFSKFKTVWDNTIKPADRSRYGWDANPWVWVIEFERISKKEAAGCAG